MAPDLFNQNCFTIAKLQIFILGISISHTGEPATRNEAPMIVLAPHSQGSKSVERWSDYFGGL
ncbi:unnamed protein product [Oikopleura dioica]|uniref:Uncharacterized protein n=1 Tax=Oikopleura dioica TaxID=34765 RepID=E4Y7L8_OIKDI|nr:unnamed protein product [Oikopleura dioica]